MLSDDAIVRTQTLTLPHSHPHDRFPPRCPGCGALLALLGRPCACHAEAHRLLWRGIAYGLLSSVGLWIVLAGLLWWLGRIV
jgi:hypothetical protein